MEVDWCGSGLECAGECFANPSAKCQCQCRYMFNADSALGTSVSAGTFRCRFCSRQSKTVSISWQAIIKETKILKPL